ncbi:MAG: hypothetical protein IPL78_31810 [Chloroflexi bacterium]|nr:hypothetical protein [Chloroflexota bacterium]
MPNEKKPTAPLRVNYSNLPDVSGLGRGRSSIQAHPPSQNRAPSARPVSARQGNPTETSDSSLIRPSTARSQSARHPAAPLPVAPAGMSGLGTQSPRIKINPKTMALNSLVDANATDGDRDTLLRGLGMNREVYDALCQVAKEQDCLIFIRSTNSGILEGLEHGHNTTGKTLSTKGKSSRYLPIKANVAFLASLGKSYLDELKKVNSEAETKHRLGAAAAQSRQLALQEKLHHEQDALIAVIDEPRKGTLKIGNLEYPTSLHIPKLLPLHRLIDIYGGPTPPTSPEWIHLKIDDTYTCQVTLPNQQTHTLSPPGVSLPAPITAQSIVREFLWVKIGSFAQTDTNFQTQMKSIPLPGWAGFDAHLAPRQDITDDNEAIYQLFFLETAFIEANEMANYWQKTASDPDDTGATQPILFGGLTRQQWLAALAPVYAGPAAAPAGTWRALHVLAQGKKMTDGTISYYEIVADFDIFCICPSLKAITTALGHKFQTDWEQRLSYYQPQVLMRGDDQALKTERGMISPFEEAVRKAINRALSKESDDQASSAMATSSGSGPRFALHGCEVNNYFYTEKFGRLIFIRPDGMEENRRFTFSTDNFVNMASRPQFTEPALNVKIRAGQWRLPGKEFNSTIGEHYLFQYNLQWNDQDHRPGAPPLNRSERNQKTP